jgi:hypothetical protein
LTGRPALDAYPQVEDLATHRHATDGIEVGLDELGNLAYQQGEAQDELAHRPPIERRMAAEPAELSRHALSLESPRDARDAVRG